MTVVTERTTDTQRLLPVGLGELTDYVSNLVGHDFNPMLEEIRKLTRRDRSQDLMVWFNFTAADIVEHSTVGWPVYAYVPHVEFEYDVLYNPKINQAYRRLARSRNIKSITVIGKIPTRWYTKAL
jgi:hypothetical protein